LGEFKVHVIEYTIKCEFTARSILDELAFNKNSLLAIIYLSWSLKREIAEREKEKFNILN